MAIEKFVVKSDDKRDFRDWLDTNFRYFNNVRDERAIREIEANKSQIHDAAMQVLYRLMTNDTLARYYSEDFVKIPDKYIRGDIREFAEAVRTFHDAINTE